MTYDSSNFDSISSRYIAIQSLPFCDPGDLRIYERDDTFEDLGAAVIDGIGGAAKVEKLLAVWAAHADEFLLCC